MKQTLLLVTFLFSFSLIAADDKKPCACAKPDKKGNLSYTSCSLGNVRQCFFEGKYKEALVLIKERKLDANLVETISDMDITGVPADKACRALGIIAYSPRKNADGTPATSPDKENVSAIKEIIKMAEKKYVYEGDKYLSLNWGCYRTKEETNQSRMKFLDLANKYQNIDAVTAFTELAVEGTPVSFYRIVTDSKDQFTENSNGSTKKEIIVDKISADDFSSISHDRGRTDVRRGKDDQHSGTGKGLSLRYAPIFNAQGAYISTWGKMPEVQKNIIIKLAQFNNLSDDVKGKYKDVDNGEKQLLADVFNPADIKTRKTEQEIINLFPTIADKGLIDDMMKNRI